MSESTELLALSVTRERLHALAAARVLDTQTLERGLIESDLRPTNSSWARYLYWHALIVGVVLLVAGTIFFVAANWSALSGVARMGLVGALLVGATLAGGYLGDTLAGRALFLLGGLLFGPLAAVYGQVYQTGADAWELFAWWSIVLIAYALVVRFAGTWVVALIAVHVACFTWIEQELGGSLYADRNAWIVAALALFDAGVVVLAERWLDGREREVLVHTAGMFGLAVVLPFGIETMVEEPPEGGVPGLLVLLVGLAAIWHVYRWRRPRLGMLVAFAAVCTILIAALVGRLLFADLDAELFGVALLGAVICGLVWAFTRWLLSWRRQHPAERSPPSEPSRPTTRRRHRLTLTELFTKLGLFGLDSARLHEALHDSDATDAPLLVRVFTAIGTWIGAAMVAAIFAAMEIHEVLPLAVVLALVQLGAAIVLSRRSKRSLALTQLIWALTLGAHGLGLIVAHELDLDDAAIATGWTLLNFALVFLIRVPSLQLASTICALGFATWLAMILELPAAPLWVALPAAAVATAVWIFEVRWAARLGRTWSALAHGLPLGIAGPLLLLNVEDGEAMVARGHAAPIATLVFVGLIGTVLWRARQEQSQTRPRLVGVIAFLHARGAGLIAVLCVIAARHVPGVSLALAWLLLAHLRRSAGLQIIALIQLAGFLFFFYYQLDTTLLQKSLWVVSTGAVLLLGAWLGRDRSPAAEPHAARQSRWLPALGLTLLSAGLIVGTSVQKQLILTHGRTVLLPLAPVDPRSLMQGDYMILRYAIEQEMGMEMFGTPVDMPRHGRLVIHLDEHGVGHFVRLDDGGDLAEDELRIEYRLRDGGARVRIGAESFFFEEGSAERFTGAAYGELAVSAGGEVVLVGLRDADRQPLVVTSVMDRESPASW